MLFTQKTILFFMLHIIRNGNQNVEEFWRVEYELKLNFHAVCHFDSCVTRKDGLCWRILLSLLSRIHISHTWLLYAYILFFLYIIISVLFFSYQRLKYSIHDLGIGIRDVINLLMIWMIGFVKLYFMLYSYLFILYADIIHWAVRLVD